MSIATNSVLGRILDDVRAAPAPAALGELQRVVEADALLEIRVCADVHRPPFPTSFHFWAHALRALLAAHERADAFRALAGNGLCEAVSGARVGEALERVAGRMAAPVALPRRDYLRGYRMIEQDVLESWVAEGADAFVALFWVRPRWLAEARHVALE